MRFALSSSQRALPIAGDAPFYVIMNAKSGHNDANEVRQQVVQTLETAGRQCEVTLVSNPIELPRVAKTVTERAAQKGGVVVAAGGDGAINTICQQLLQASSSHSVALGILPQGTFNYFARTHGIPEDLDEALKVLTTHPAQPVQAGMVNQRIFLVNTSLGLYPHLLEMRENYTRQYGRSRAVAFIGGFFTLLGQHNPLQISLELQGRRQQMRTSMLFIGNNQLQLERLGMTEAEAPTRQQLAAVMLKPVGKLDMLGLIVRGALGRLGEAENLVSFSFRRMTVGRPSLRSRRIKVAIDGEIVLLDAPLEFRVAPQPLYLIKPPHRNGD